MGFPAKQRRMSANKKPFTEGDDHAIIPELIHSSSCVFTGTVVALVASTVPILPARENFAVVRVDRGLRVEPALGDLRGRTITVETRTPEELRVDQKAIFFTIGWIHGGGIGASGGTPRSQYGERER
jgi:hypothetical protein